MTHSFWEVFSHQLPLLQALPGNSSRNLCMVKASQPLPSPLSPSLRRRCRGQMSAQPNEQDSGPRASQPDPLLGTVHPHMCGRHTPSSASNTLLYLLPGRLLLALRTHFKHHLLREAIPDSHLLLLLGAPPALAVGTRVRDPAGAP